MNDQVLTDEEKNALIDGVESGEVEVQSSAGPTYASVEPFRIPARCRIVKDSYPRLQLLNQQVAERLTRDLEQLLQREVEVTANDLAVASFAGLCEAFPGAACVMEFEAAPLAGSGLIILDPAMVHLLVEIFFGGQGDGPEIGERSSFTAGELSVCNLFCAAILSVVAHTWAALQEITTSHVSTELSVDLVDIANENDPVITTEFETVLAERQSSFRVVLPTAMLQPLLPIFAGQKGDRDPAEDARWEQALRRRVADSVVRLTSRVGHARMTLGELVDLTPGDVIEIEDPQQATVMARNVRLIHGRLGVHRGRNAVETIEWIDPLQADLANTGI